MSTNSGRVPPLVLGLICGALLSGVPMYYQLAAANNMVQNLESERAALLTQRNDLAKRDLPVVVRHRGAFLQPGSVLMIQNVSGSDLTLTAQFGRQGAPSVTKEVVIAANGVASIGGAQGWAFEPGDSIKLSNPQYRDWFNNAINW